MAPISLHRYLYANGSPITFDDPSGEFTLMQVTATMAVVGALSGVAIYHYSNDEHSPIGYVLSGLAGASVGAVAGHYAWYAVPQLSWMGVPPAIVKTWQEAEQFIARTLEIAKYHGDKLIINGRGRIPDYLDHSRKFIADSKFVNSQALTSQMRDYIQYANDQGYRFYIFVRHDTHVTKPLLEAIQEKGGSVVRLFVK